MNQVITRCFYHFICIVVFLSACQPSDKKDTATNQATDDWQYFGLEYPNEKPMVFSPDIISTYRNERDFTRSPSGNTIFYSRVLPANNLSVILFLYFDGFFWSEPQVAIFSGQYKDLEPSFSPDGKKVFFASKRPVDNTLKEKDYDIWYIERTDNGWSNPKNVESPINTGSDEYFPSVSQNGNLYFTASYDDSFGAEDIYFSRFENGVYIAPMNLGDSINSALYDFNAFIAPDESYLVFSSFGREDGAGGGDLYIAYRKEDGSWTKARNMGSQINSEKLDYCPFVTYDEKFLFFTSQRESSLFTNRKRKQIKEIDQLENSIENGLGNIYWVAFDKNAWR
jgi:hypothetical protein